jgi:hypothetical protein
MDGGEWVDGWMEGNGWMDGWIDKGTSLSTSFIWKEATSSIFKKLMIKIPQIRGDGKKRA